ncbi:hem degrading domain containing protein [Pyrenophora tritici-repentis]|uniref:Hem-degrading domain containing protein n=2 Tax=Pyrenophora tritici-repentis TaxID=45151 RepID=A0A2W1DSW7_9PLEO|nr:hem degrading domain containing protein [Pyrenophora tritici-repentis]KAF7577252.1 hypothetical protein PtrM4_014920 [Pyrenophora tritici-repentis]KAG9387910.1 hem degrading domain containing protein [Pyrenophora tritici-repentis]KAI1521003.1 hem-degrading domain containing protein [Pyrenophora tritici-repentis]KAI1674648.1 hem-degrading domain containing protein [Pyrenophora tritici-repentis]
MSQPTSQSAAKMLNTLPKPTRDLLELAREEKSFTFNHFTCEHAWVIGNILRNSLRTAECPALIHISIANQTLFHSPSLPGMMPDHEKWAERKRNTVLRWGHSTWFVSCQFDGDFKKFTDHHAMSGDERSMYTLEGGGYPVFVKGVEGVVGTIVIVGLGMDSQQSHGVVIKAVEEYKDLREGFRSPMRSTTIK